jgi:type II secretory pathway pseudopilin PulG
LVEILVVITIMALLVTLVATFATNLLDDAEVTACQSNLKEIAQNMILMKNDRRQRGKKGWPNYKGIRFLLELTKGSSVSKKLAYISGQKAKIFICPGTNDVNITELDDTPGAAYYDLDNVDSYTISYAGRNQVDYPIDKDKLGDDAVLAADDNEGQANHKFNTNYVTVGPAVVTLDIRDFLDDFPELAELEYLPVGPDSPSDKLQKLLVDY